MSLSNAEQATAFDGPVDRSATLSATRPFYWSVRRELWEHRAIYVAPLAASGVVLFGFLLGLHKLASTVRSLKIPAAMVQNAALAPYAFAAAAMLVTGLIVAVFYSLGALNNERRDRSILFWKSLPVSDLTTVLSKTFVPLVVLPLVVFATTVATQLVMLVMASAVLMANGLGPSLFWAQLPKMTL